VCMVLVSLLLDPIFQIEDLPLGVVQFRVVLVYKDNKINPYT
jgi:hypothetical protein